MRARVRIFVPADLKLRMDAATDIDWSQIAIRAFEATLRDRDGSQGQNGDEASPKADPVKVRVVKYSVLSG